MTKITIDPITRIEGHLKIEVEVDNGRVVDAWSSGTLFRGFEIFLRDRDPRDAWFITQRICGVCPVSHGHMSTLSLEDSFGVTPPDNARLVRNLIEGGQYLHSHILWFYHLTAMDYVDVVDALQAQPQGQYLKDVQAKLKKFVESGQLGPFTKGYWGHPAYKLPSEVNLLAVAHYLEALEMQAKASWIVGVLGGKIPMHMSSVPGGTTYTPTMDGLQSVLYRVKEINDWVDGVYLPDVLAIAPFYLDMAQQGRSKGNLLAWGVFEEESRKPEDRLLPRGMVLDGKLELLQPEEAKVTEEVTHSWFDGDGALHPYEGKTDPNYTGYDPNGEYSWVKSPRYEGRPLEVGPLSRVVVAYLAGNEQAKAMVDSTLETLGVPGQVDVLFSALGRIAARVIETKMVADAMERYTLEIMDNIRSGNKELFTPHEIPNGAQGVGLWEAPRGALGHWNVIRNKKIANYQCVVPTTWNVSPRDAAGVRGPIEESLIGTPVADPEKPLEVLRVVHSFDPCLACAVHIIHPRTNQVLKFQAV